MTLCVEPAIYVPDLFGARLADVAACTREAATVLTTSPHTLRVLDH
jgi:Xaa-Pro dipeptidase